jgi:hypothetical protein
MPTGAANVERARSAELKVALSVLANVLGEGWWMGPGSGRIDS